MKETDEMDMPEDTDKVEAMEGEGHLQATAIKDRGLPSAASAIKDRGLPTQGAS